MAEAHPVAFRYVMQAKERGATVIHVDPRFSRTSAAADIWVSLRAGGDIALLGGLIRYILENDLFFRDYVTSFTNAACILREDFQDTEELDGFFSGWDAGQNSYNNNSWMYESGDLGRPTRDDSLQHPRCVLQVLKRHFARYTPEMVQSVAGVPPKLVEQVARKLAEASGPDKTAAICYAVGWTQQSKGVQIIRAASILQLLLGNIGRPGGGIMALRGHASIQGSTDIPTLYHLLPGYLPMPQAGADEETFTGYLGKHTKETGWWSNFSKYAVSLMKAYYGDRATPDNEFGWKWMPRLDGNHSHFNFFGDMFDRKIEGLFVMGQNPAVGGPNAKFHRQALGRLKWLVVRDFVETETSAFWKSSREVVSGEISPEDIDTEVFLFPAAGHAEKSGTFTNTQRLLQWREKAVEPPGDATSEAWFMHQLAKRLIAKANASNDPMDEPLRALDWWYPELSGTGEPDAEAVLAEINGWHVEQGSCESVKESTNGETEKRPGKQQLGGFAELKDDGSTACGCWIYSGVFGPDGVNRARGRESQDEYGHGWGFAWPADRRVLYNRASARPDGSPWSDAKSLVWWDKDVGKWTGKDVPDFPVTKSPDYLPGEDATGMDAHSGQSPFLMQRDGLGWLFAPEGLKDGPIPTHFEPLESPVKNKLYSQQSNPNAERFDRPENRLAESLDERFPFVLTTYRLTEHQTAGAMTRNLSRLGELQPEAFAEMSHELAESIGVKNGDNVDVTTPRGSIRVKACVTRRLQPISLGDQQVHQVAIPFHFGVTGLVSGESANELVPMTGEPNVTIHEAKVLVCNVELASG